MQTEISFQIILVKPTPGCMFGLQQGSGNNYTVVQKQMAGSDDLSFVFTAKIKGDRAKDAAPKFSGDFIQGPAGAKFVYIGIGTYAGQLDSVWSRRLKVPLTGIEWKDIDAMSEQTFLQTMVPGTGKDGGPNCATVKPFDGWRLSHK